MLALSHLIKSFRGALVASFFVVVGMIPSLHAQCDAKGHTVPDFQFRRSHKGSYFPIDIRSAAYFPCNAQNQLWVLVGPAKYDGYLDQPIEVSLTDSGAVTLIGPTSWTMTAGKGVVCTTLVSMQATCPDSGIVRVTVRFPDGHDTWTMARFYPNGDSVKFCPQGCTDAPLSMLVDLPEGMDRPEISDTRWTGSDDPMALVKETVIQGNPSPVEIARAHLKSRSLHPLTDMDDEVIEIEGVYYQRLRGETEFRVMKTYTTEEIRSGKGIDSVSAANLPKTYFEVEIVVPNEEAMKTVRTVTDSLEATQQPTVFRTRIDTRQFQKLDDSDLEYRVKVNGMYIDSRERPRRYPRPDPKAAGKR